MNMKKIFERIMVEQTMDLLSKFKLNDVMYKYSFDSEDDECCKIVLQYPDGIMISIKLKDALTKFDMIAELIIYDVSQKFICKLKLFEETKYDEEKELVQVLKKLNDDMMYNIVVNKAKKSTLDNDLLFEKTSEYGFKIN